MGLNKFLEYDLQSSVLLFLNIVFQTFLLIDSFSETVWSWYYLY